MSALETIVETAAGVALGGLFLLACTVAVAARARAHMKRAQKAARAGGPGAG